MYDLLSHKNRGGRKNACFSYSYYTRLYFSCAYTIQVMLLVFFFDVRVYVFMYILYVCLQCVYV